MLPDNNAFRVTTSKYYLPSGRLIQNFADADWAENMQISREEINTAYRTDGGRSVYGGGGIAPDIPIMRDSVSVLSTMLTYGNYFFRFAVDYRAEHGDSIPNRVTDEMLDSFREYVYDEEFEYPNFVHEQLDSLRNGLAGLDGSSFEAVLSRIRAKAEQIENDDWRQSRGFIRDRLCERFANLRGGREEIYRSCRLQNDEQVLSAFEIVSDTALYNSILRPE
jgi:carboxyl-terminal processing protease